MTPQKSRAYKEPSTPGSKAQAGMDDGLLSVSPELLPANLMLLNQLLGELQALAQAQAAARYSKHFVGPCLL